MTESSCIPLLVIIYIMSSKILVGIVILSIYSTFEIATAEKEIELPFVVSFIYKDVFPVTTLCSGVILTEKFILSAAYPIVLMRKGDHCVLPGFQDLQNVTETEAERDCKRIHRFHKAKKDVNLVIAELKKSLFFKWTISTVQFIVPQNILKYSYNHSCLVPGWKYEKAIPSPGSPSHLATELTVHEITIENVEKQYGSFKPRSKDLFFCNAHIGMPLLCDYFLVGVIANADLNGNIECKSYPFFSYTNIMTPDIQDYLKAVIGLSDNLKLYLGI